MKKKNTKSLLIGKKEGFKTKGRQIVCSICEESGGTLTKMGGKYVHSNCFSKKLEEKIEERNKKLEKREEK